MARRNAPFRAEVIRRYGTEEAVTRPTPDLPPGTPKPAGGQAA